MSLTIVLLWVVFLVQHTAMSHPPIRAALIARLGVWPFRGVYTVLSFVPFVPMTLIWWEHRHDSPALWSLGHGAHVAELFALLGFAMVVAALARTAPAALYTRLRGDRIEPIGMAAVTRHPMFIGLSIWATAHAMVNATPVDLAFWGGFPLYTIVGVLHQDARKVAEDPRYADFVTRSSVIPFARPGNLKYLGGRATVGLVLGLALGVVIRMLHPVLFR